MTSQRKPENTLEVTLTRELARLHEGIERLVNERLVNREDARKGHEDISAALKTIVGETQESPGESKKLERAITSAPKEKRGRKGKQAHIALFIELHKREGKTWPQTTELCNKEFRHRFTQERVRTIWRFYYGDKRPAFDQEPPTSAS